MNSLKPKRNSMISIRGEKSPWPLSYGKLGWVLLILAVAGCYSLKVENAFKGKFASHEGNKIILDYCKSCHLHKDFDSSLHVEEMSLDYKRKVFRYATECRVCHFVKKRWYLNDYLRKTRRPREANAGKYEKFERSYLKFQKETVVPLLDDKEPDKDTMEEGRIEKTIPPIGGKAP